MLSTINLLDMKKVYIMEGIAIQIFIHYFNFKKKSV